MPLFYRTSSTTETEPGFVFIQAIDGNSQLEVLPHARLNSRPTNRDPRRRDESTVEHMPEGVSNPRVRKNVGHGVRLSSESAWWR